MKCQPPRIVRARYEAGARIYYPSQGAWGFWSKAALVFLIACFVVLTVLGGMARADESQDPLAEDQPAVSGIIDREADPDTADTYKQMLGEEADGGRYTGRVWTDKSVYSDSSVNLDADVLGYDNTVTNDADFLTVYSALGSTRVLNGQATTPLDVVLMLDVSTSMSTKSLGDGQYEQVHYIDDVVDEANKLIGQLMAMNELNRIAVVAYGGGTYTVLPLDHYTATGTSGTYIELKQETANGKWWNKLVATATGKEYGPQTTAGPYLYADATYLQGAIYEGTQILVEEKETTYIDEQNNEQNRIPAIIVLSDGGTNVCSTTESGGSKVNGSYEWWEPYTGTMPTARTATPADYRNYCPKPNGNPLYVPIPSDKTIGDNNYPLAIPSRTLATLLTANRQKLAVEDHYKVDMQAYSIGFNIDGLGSMEKQQLYSTLDPVNYFTADSSGPGQNGATASYDMVREAYEVWLTYKSSATPTMTYTSAKQWLSTTLQGSWTFNHPDTFDPAELDNLNYINTFYNANSANLNDIFDNILSQLGGLAFHPVSSGGVSSSGGVTFTDPIGEYLEIKDFKSLTLFGKQYYVVEDPENPGTYYVSTSPDAVVDATVVNPNYVNITSFNLSDISIKVTTEPSKTYANTNTQTLVVNIPESALPLRKEVIDLNVDVDANNNQTVRSYNTNKDTTDALPLRLYYTVGIVDSIKTEATKNENKNYQIDLSKVDPAYRADHADVTDGSIEFFSNMYTNGPADAAAPQGTLGDAVVSFSPSTANRYYFFQANRIIYAKADGLDAKGEGITTQYGGTATVDEAVTDVRVFSDPENLDKNYYLVIDFYRPTSNGNGEYVEMVVSRTGEELQNSVGYYNTVTKEEVQESGDNVVVATVKGTPRLGRLNRFASTKSENPTDTATYAYMPTYVDPPTTRNELFRIYLGNNGRLKVRETGILVTKTIDQVPEGLDYGNEPTFTYTIRVQGMAGQSIDAIEYAYDADHDAWLPVRNSDASGFVSQTIELAPVAEDTTAPDASDDAPQVEETTSDPLTTTADGEGTFTLQNGHGLQFVGLPPDVVYTITETAEVTNPSDGISTILGEQPEGTDGYFYFVDVTGSGTPHADDRTMTGTTVNGEIQQVHYVNSFTKAVAYTTPELPIYKELVGRPFDPDYTFTFQMTAVPQDGQPAAPMPAGTNDQGVYTKTMGPTIQGTEVEGTDPVTYRSEPLVFLGDDADAANTITFSQPGTYVYLIQEVRPSGGSSLAGVTYDRTRYRLTIDVTVDAEHNTLAVTPTRIEKSDATNADAYEDYWTAATDPDAQNMALTFTNRYNANDVQRFFGGTKVLNGEGAPAIQDGQFAFTLEALGSHSVTSEETYDNLKDGSPLSASEKVTYIEDHVSQSDVGWVTDDVTQPMPGNSENGNAEGTYPQVTVTAAPDGRFQFEPVLFTRALPLEGSTDQGLEMRGVIYKYQLYENQPTENGRFDGTPLEGATLVTVGTDDNGNPIERWNYQGVTYNNPESRVFYVYVHLDPDPNDPDGTVIHASLLGDAPVDAAAATSFVNTYSALTSLPLTAQKIIEGRPFQEGDAFTFSVTGTRLEGSTGVATVAPLPSGVSSNGTITITPAQDGDDPSNTQASIDLGSISFTQADAGNTYEYVLREVAPNPAIGGVAASQEVYTLRVAVTGDGKGNLRCTVTDAEGAPIDPAAGPVATWTNEYQPQAATLTYNGTKTLIGAPLANAAFSFTVAEADANGTVTGASATVLNQAGPNDATTSTGAITLLSNVSYQQPGDYYYLVSEIGVRSPSATPGTDANNQIMTLDTRQFLIHVTVTDNLKGQLQARVADVKVRDDSNQPWNDAPQGVAFQNSYGGVAFYPLSLTKAMLGADLAAIEKPFEFVLAATPQDGVQMPSATLATAGPDGTITFPEPVVFTQEGTYRISVYEKQPTEDGTLEGTPLPGAVQIADGRYLYQGILYSANQAVTEVTVTRDETTGALVAQRTSMPTVRTFVNDAGVTLSKELAFPEGMTPTDDDYNQTFSFDVFLFQTDQTGIPGDSPVSGTFPIAWKQMAEDGSVSYGVDPAQPTVTFGSDGRAILELKGGQSVRIYGIPQGTSYRVTEQTPSDWTLTDPATGVVEGTVAPNATALATFTNTKNLAATSASIEGLKVLQGRPLADNEFSVVLTPADDATMTAVQNGTVVLAQPTEGSTDPVTTLTVPVSGPNENGTGYWAFRDIVFAQEGTYTFAIAEVQPAADDGATQNADGTWTLNGVTYDPQSFTVTVTVTDGKDGSLVATVVPESSEMTFTNTYEAGVVSVPVAGTKTLDGRPLQDGEFAIALYGPNNPDNLLDTTLVKADGTFSFEPTRLVYTTQDLASATPDENGQRSAVFTYVVREVVPDEGALPGVNYDATVYTLTVTVTDDGNGTLTARTQVDPAPNEGTLTSTDLAFTNTYRPNGEASATLEVQKVLQGRDMANAEFSFLVYDCATGEPVAKMIAPASPSGVPAFTSTAIPYDANAMLDATVGEDGGPVRTKQFVYEIREVNGHLGGITYDTTSIYAVVTVVDDGAGTLSTSAPVYYYDRELTAPVEGTPTFTNTYNAQPAIYVPQAFKTTDVHETTDLSGLRFGYEITTLDGTPVAAGTSGAQGSATFEPLVFEASGTYRYLVKEVAGGYDGITYDTAVYTLEISVSDPGTGALTIEHAIYRAPDGTTLGGAPTFANVYDGGIAQLTLSASKTLEGRDLSANEFSFVLVDQDTGQEVATATSDANGNVVFSTLTYHYRITQPEQPTEPETPDESVTTPTEPETPENPDEPSVTPEEPDGGDATKAEQPTEPEEQPVEPEEPAVTPADPVGDDGASDGVDAGDAADFSPAGEGVVVLPLDQNPLTARVAIADDTDAEPYVSETLEEVAQSEGAAVSADPQLESSDLGMHHYVMYELVPDGATQNADGTWTYRDVTYSNDRYYITVEVYDTGEQSIAARVVAVELWAHGDPAQATPVTLTGSNGMGNVSFANSYEPSEPPTVTLEGSKTLTGRPMSAMEFGFVVYDANGEPVALGTNGTAAEPGQESELFFTPFATPQVPGVYEYQVHELRAGTTLAGVTYSTQVFRVLVTVDFDANNALVASVAYPDGPIAFTNTYAVNTEVSVTLEGTKMLLGRPMSNGEFRFEVRDAAGTLVTAGASTEADAGETSPIEFGTLTFTRVGSYDFTVTELQGGTVANGIAYDSRSFAVHVEVTDNGDGTLAAQVSYPNGPIAFENAYTATPATAAMGATKTLEGRDLTEGAFTFTLTDVASGNVVAQATNAADGSVRFMGISYATPGTYDYEIAEVAGDEEGMTYDQHVYRVRVEVTDPGNGQLDAMVTYLDSYGMPTFKNVYEEPQEPDTPDEPNQPGRPNVPDEPTAPSVPATPPSSQVPTTGDTSWGTPAIIGVAAVAAVLVGAAIALLVGVRKRHSK